MDISSTPTAIPSLLDFELDLGETEEIDVTTHDSTGDTREFVNGFKNPADMTIPIVFDADDTVHQYLQAAHGGAAEDFVLTLPNTGAATYTFSALVKGFSIASPVDGRQEATMTLKPTGAIVFAA